MRHLKISQLDSSIQSISIAPFFVAIAFTGIQCFTGRREDSDSMHHGSFGVLYAGVDPYSAFVESLLKSPDNRVVTTSALKQTGLAELRPKFPLRLVDLTPSGSLVRIGADARLFSADRSVAQLWSKALHDHPVCAHGILYPSRLDPVKQSVALFSDRDPKLVELNRQAWYAPGPQRELLAQIAEHYRIELIEDRFIAPKRPVATVIQPGVFDF